VIDASPRQADKPTEMPLQDFSSNDNSSTMDNYSSANINSPSMANFKTVGANHNKPVEHVVPHNKGPPSSTENMLKNRFQVHLLLLLLLLLCKSGGRKLR
jgi:hypothetical protein